MYQIPLGKAEWNIVWETAYQREFQLISFLPLNFGTDRGGMVVDQTSVNGSVELWLAVAENSTISQSLGYFLKFKILAMSE